MSSNKSADNARLIAGAVKSMVEFYDGDMRDINHFIKVQGWASTIGSLEGLDERAQLTLELAAIVHDIACPLCRKKYGSADGKRQEEEGPVLAREFLQKLGCDEAMIERVSWLVGHHHTYTDVEGADHRILLEADFLVNAYEGKASPQAILSMRDNVFRTQAGIGLLNSAYKVEA